MARAKIEGLTAIEVPEEVFRIFFATGESVNYENVRVFIEGTQEKTLSFESIGLEASKFGKK